MLSSQCFKCHDNSSALRLIFTTIPAIATAELGSSAQQPYVQHRNNHAIDIVSTLAHVEAIVRTTTREVKVMKALLRCHSLLRRSRENIHMQSTLHDFTAEVRIDGQNCVRRWWQCG